MITCIFSKSKHGSLKCCLGGGIILKITKENFVKNWIKYLIVHCLNPARVFSFKYFPKDAHITKIPPKSLGFLKPLPLHR